MAEIQAPKSHIFYLQSYLKSSETMKAFSLFCYNKYTKQMAYYSQKKERSNFNTPQQKFDSYLG